METSPTQRQLATTDVARLVAASFGTAVRVRDCGPMTGGGFAAVWWAALNDGRQVVLKTSPPPGVRLLSYERGLLAAEARYYRLAAARAPGVPLPRVLHYGDDPNVLDGDWLFTTRLPGTPLATLLSAQVDDRPVRQALGGVAATLHGITGTRFGYDGSRTGGPTWRGAFIAMVDELLADAVAWQAPLPMPPDRIRDLVDRHAGVLDEVSQPALLHFDNWDGNVLAAPDATGQLRLCGLVDGERWLYGDPVMDFVSPALYARIEAEPGHPFVQGYQAATGVPVVFDSSVRRRLILYRMHLYLLMVTEMPSRGMDWHLWPERHERLTDLLAQQLTALAG